MMQTQLDTVAVTKGVTVPIAGIRISDLIGSLPFIPRFVMVEATQPGVATEHADILFTTKRPGATAVVAGDYTNHSVLIAAGTTFSRPFNGIQDCYLKPVAASDAPIVLTIG